MLVIKKITSLLVYSSKEGEAINSDKMKLKKDILEMRPPLFLSKRKKQLLNSCHTHPSIPINTVPLSKFYVLTF